MTTSTFVSLGPGEEARFDFIMDSERFSSMTYGGRIVEGGIAAEFAGGGKSYTINLVEITVKDSGYDTQDELEHVKMTGGHCDDGYDFTDGDTCVEGVCKGKSMCQKDCEVHSGEELFDVVVDDIARTGVNEEYKVEPGEEFPVKLNWANNNIRDAEVNFYVDGVLQGDSENIEDDQITLVDENLNPLAPDFVHNIEGNGNKYFQFKIKGGVEGSAMIRADVIYPEDIEGDYTEEGAEIASITIVKHVPPTLASCLPKSGSSCYSGDSCSSGVCVQGECTKIKKDCVVESSAELYEVVIDDREPMIIGVGDGFTDFVDFENVNSVAVDVTPFVDGEIADYIRGLSISNRPSFRIDSGKEKVEYTVLPKGFEGKKEGKIRVKAVDAKGCYGCNDYGREECADSGPCVVGNLLNPCKPDPDVCEEAVNTETTLASISIERYEHEGADVCLGKSGRDVIGGISSNKCRLLDVSIKGCVPCLKLDDVIEELESKYPGKYIIEKIDGIEEESLARKYGVESYPTLVFVDKNGDAMEVLEYDWYEEGEEYVGERVDVLKTMLDRNLPKCSLFFVDSCDDENACTENQCEGGKCAEIPKKCPDCQTCKDSDYTVTFTRLGDEDEDSEFLYEETGKTRNYKKNEGEEITQIIKYTNRDKGERTAYVSPFYYDSNGNPVYVGDESLSIMHDDTGEIEISMPIDASTVGVNKIKFLVHLKEWNSETEEDELKDAKFEDVIDVTIKRNFGRDRMSCSPDDSKTGNLCDLPIDDTIPCKGDYGLCINGFCDEERCTKETEKEVCGGCMKCIFEEDENDEEELYGKCVAFEDIELETCTIETEEEVCEDDEECVFEDEEALVGECVPIEGREEGVCTSSSCSVDSGCNSCDSSDTLDLSSCPPEFNTECVNGFCQLAEKNYGLGPKLYGYENEEACTDPVFLYPSYPSTYEAKLSELGVRYLSDDDLSTYEGLEKGENKLNEFLDENPDMTDEVRNLAGIDIGKVRLYRARLDREKLELGYLYLLAEPEQEDTSPGSSYIKPMVPRLNFHTAINEFGQEVVTEWQEASVNEKYISIQDDTMPPKVLGSSHYANPNYDIIKGLKENPTGYSKFDHSKQHYRKNQMRYLLDRALFRGVPYVNLVTREDNQNDIIAGSLTLNPDINTPYNTMVRHYNQAAAQYQKVRADSLDMLGFLKDKEAFIQSSFNLATLYSETGQFQGGRESMDMVVNKLSDTEWISKAHLFKGELWRDESVFVVPDPEDMSPLYVNALKSFRDAINTEPTNQYAKNAYEKGIAGSLKVIQVNTKMQIEQAKEILAERTSAGMGFFTVKCVAGYGTDDLIPEYDRDTTEISDMQMGVLLLSGLYEEHSKTDPYYLDTFLSASEIDKIRAIADLNGLWMPTDKEIKDEYGISEVTYLDMDKYICDINDATLTDHWNLADKYSEYIDKAVRTLPDIALLTKLEKDGENSARALMQDYGASGEDINRARDYLKFRIVEDYVYIPESYTFVNEMMASLTGASSYGFLMIGGAVKIPCIAYRGVKILRMNVLLKYGYSPFSKQAFKSMGRGLARGSIEAMQEICFAPKTFATGMSAMGKRTLLAVNAGARVAVKKVGNSVITFVFVNGVEEVLTEPAMQSLLLFAGVNPDVAMIVSEFIGLPGGGANVPRPWGKIESKFSFVVPDVGGQTAKMHPELIFETVEQKNRFIHEARETGRAPEGYVEMKDPETGEFLGNALFMSIEEVKGEPFVEREYFIYSMEEIAKGDVDLSKFKWGKIAHGQFKQSQELAKERDQFKAYAPTATYLTSDNREVSLPKVHVIEEPMEEKITFIEIIVRDENARQTLMKKVLETYVPLYVKNNHLKEFYNPIRGSRIRVHTHGNWIDFHSKTHWSSSHSEPTVYSYYVRTEEEQIPSNAIEITTPVEIVEEWKSTFHHPEEFVDNFADEALQGNRAPKLAPVKVRTGKKLKDEHTHIIFPEKEMLGLFKGVDPADLVPVSPELAEEYLSGYRTDYVGTNSPPYTPKTPVEVVEWDGEIWFKFIYKYEPHVEGELIAPMKRGITHISNSHLTKYSDELRNLGISGTNSITSLFGFDTLKVFGRADELKGELLVLVKRPGNQVLKQTALDIPSQTEQIHSSLNLNSEVRANRIRASQVILRFMGIDIRQRNLIMTEIPKDSYLFKDGYKYEFNIFAPEKPISVFPNPRTHPGAFEFYLKTLKEGRDLESTQEYIDNPEKFKEVTDFAGYVDKTMDVGFDPTGARNNEAFRTKMMEIAEIVEGNRDIFVNRWESKRPMDKMNIYKGRKKLGDNIAGLSEHLNDAWMILKAKGLTSTSPNALTVRAEALIEKANKMKTLKVYTLLKPSHIPVSSERALVGEIVEYDYNHAHGIDLDPSTPEGQKQIEALKFIAAATREKVERGYNPTLEGEAPAETFFNAGGTMSIFESDYSREYSEKLSKELGREIKAIEVGWFAGIPGKEMGTENYKSLFLKAIARAKDKGYNSVIFQSRWNHGRIHRLMLKRIFKNQKCDLSKLKSREISVLLRMGMDIDNKNPLETVVYEGLVEDPEEGKLWKIIEGEDADGNPALLPIQMDVTLVEDIDVVAKILAKNLKDSLKVKGV